MNFELPQALETLRHMRRWCAWQYRDTGDGKPKKIPYTPKTQTAARVNDIATWGAVHDAIDTPQAAGVGFLLGGGVAGVDLDNVFDAGGNVINPEALDIVRRLDSYTEFSPSGRGLHVLVFVPDGFTLDGQSGRRDDKRGLEIYCGLHYLTVTGKTYGHEKNIEYRQNELQGLYRECFVAPPVNVMKTPVQNASQAKIFSGVTGTTGHESDDELWRYMFDSPANGSKIRALYGGNMAAYQSQSEADMALCNYLAYYTRHDAGRVDRMFRQSALMRPKWDERHGTSTYGEQTIARAIAATPQAPTQTNTPQKAGGGVKWVYEDPTANTVRISDGTMLKADSNGHDATSTPQHKPVDSPLAFNMLDYVKTGLFVSDIEHEKRALYRLTGFSNLDTKNVRLYSGLYVIGSITGGGKTTFCLQLADYLAGAGEQVIYYAYEQPRLQLLSKSLARIMAATQSFDTALTANAIRTGTTNDNVKKAVDYYMDKIAANMHIVECQFAKPVEEIQTEISDFIKATGEKPVVFVDYLQLVKQSNARLATREALDSIVTAFKKMSAEYDIVVILISSLNRQNYLNVIDFESFKETGAIEYSADVIWGLQLLCMNAPIFNSSKDIQAKRGFIREAKRAPMRQIELINLKDRFGQPNNRYFFNYYPDHDLFDAVDMTEDVADADTDKAWAEYQAKHGSTDTATGTATGKKKYREAD